MNVLALLGIAKWGRVATLVCVFSASAAAGGFWAGTQWTEGRKAVAEVVDLKADAAVLRSAAEELRRNSVTSAQDMRTSARRMDVIAAQHMESLDAIDGLFSVQREVLDAQLNSAAAAELVACRFGAFGVRVWNEAAAGITPAAAAATGADTWWSPAPVPGESSDLVDWLWRGSDQGVAAGGQAISPLPGATGGPDEGGESL